jgi:hypothetical protein
MTSLKFWVLTAVLFVSPLALATQKALVSSDTATIHIQPDSTSEVLAEVHVGDALKASSKPKSGWYKVLVPGTEGSARYGWIDGKQITIESMVELQKEYRIQPGKPRFEEDRFVTEFHNWVSIMGFATKFAPYDLQSKAELNQEERLSPWGAIEGGWPISQHWSFVVHYSGLAQSQQGTVGNKYYVNSNQFAGCLDLCLICTPRMRIRLGAGPFVTFTTVTISQLEVATDNHINGDRATFLYGAEATFNYQQYLGKTMGFQIGAGYRYLQIPELKVGRNLVDLQLSGPYAQIGLFFDR